MHTKFGFLTRRFAGINSLTDCLNDIFCLLFVSRDKHFMSCDTSQIVQQ